MVEQWKEIKDYSNYEVSNLGRVRNAITKRIRKPNSSYGLYYVVNLRNEYGFKLLKIHRLVAQAFIPNYDNKREVNHIDGDKHNNCVNNLEWATRKENAIHSIKNGLQTREQIIKAVSCSNTKTKKKLLQLKNGKIICKFESCREASRKLNLSCSAISSCANGKYKTMYGYEWRYE